MKSALFVLIFLNVIIPLFFIGRNIFVKKRVECDHLLIFSLGYVFYWILPVYFGLKRTYVANDILAPWHILIEKMDPAVWVSYLMFGMTCYLCFVAGSSLGHRLFKDPRVPIIRLPYDKRLLNIFLFVAVLIGAVYAYNLQDFFFTGYTVTAVPPAKGSFTACTVFIFSLAILYGTKIQEENNFTARFHQVILNRYFIVATIFSLLVLSLGGRTFFVSWILILMIYQSVFFRGYRLKTVGAILAVIIVASSMYPALRAGIPLSLDSIVGDLSMTNPYVFLFFVDPIFNSFNLVHFLSEYPLPLINFPTFLVSDFINFIPTAVFPEKGLFVLHPSDYGHVIKFSGVALHNFFSLMINFGVIGTIIFFFLLSFILEVLKVNPALRAFRSIYILITGWLAISFFRDFETTMVKLIFEFSILAPLGIMILLHVVTTAAKKVR